MRFGPDRLVAKAPRLKAALQGRYCISRDGLKDLRVLRCLLRELLTDNSGGEGAERRQCRNFVFFPVNDDDRDAGALALEYKRLFQLLGRGTRRNEEPSLQGVVAGKGLIDFTKELPLAQTGGIAVSLALDAEATALAARRTRIATMLEAGLGDCDGYTEQRPDQRGRKVLKP